jgi:hypothetical protein
VGNFSGSVSGSQTVIILLGEAHDVARCRLGEEL